MAVVVVVVVVVTKNAFIKFNVTPSVSLVNGRSHDTINIYLGLGSSTAVFKLKMDSVLDEQAVSVSN